MLHPLEQAKALAIEIPAMTILFTGHGSLAVAVKSGTIAGQLND
jgi:hypothetical protein